MKNLSKEEGRTAEEMTALGIALKFAEIFQNHYPKKPLLKMMDDLRQDIETYASQFKSQSAVGWIKVKTEKDLPNENHLWDEEPTYVVRIFHDDRGSHIEELTRDEILEAALGEDGAVCWLKER